MPKFKVGDRVRLREDSDYYGASEQIKQGKIYKIDDDHGELYWVEDDNNGVENCYNDNNLDLLQMVYHPRLIPKSKTL